VVFLFIFHIGDEEVIELLSNAIQRLLHLLELVLLEVLHSLIVKQQFVFNVFVVVIGVELVDHADDVVLVGSCLVGEVVAVAVHPDRFSQRRYVVV
jgi:hypothetical protein